MLLVSCAGVFRIGWEAAGGAAIAQEDGEDCQPVTPINGRGT